VKEQRNFSNAQRVFIEAKALLNVTKETMRKEVERKARELNIDPFSKEIGEVEKYVEIEMKAEEKYKYWEVNKAYNTAFWELLKWTISELKRQYPKKAKELEPLLNPDNKLFVHTRQEEISDTLLRLSI